MQTQGRYPIVQIAGLLLGLTLLLLLVLRPSTTVPIGITAENVTQLQQVERLGDGHIYDMAWSPDGATIALAGSIGIWLYDAEQPDAPPRLLDDHTSSVSTIAFSPDGSRLASVGRDFTIYLWDTGSWTVTHILTGHDSSLRAVLFTPDGRYLISTDDLSIAATTRLWDVETGEQVSIITHEIDHKVEQMTISADGQLLATMYPDMIQVWSLPDGEHVGLLEIPYLRRRSRIAFNSSGDIFLFSIPNDESLIAWQIAADNTLVNLEVLPSLSLGLSAYLFPGEQSTLQPDMQAELSAIRQRSYIYEGHGVNSRQDSIGRFEIRRNFNLIELWRTDGQSPEAVLHEGSSSSNSLYVVETSLIGSSSGNDFQIWDLDTGEYRFLEFDSFSGRIIHIINRNQELFGYFRGRASDRLFNLKTGEVVDIFDDIVAYEFDKYPYVFSPDGRYLAFNTEHRNTAIWDLEIGEQISELIKGDPVLPHEALAFSPDSRLLATGLFNYDCRCQYIMLWDVQTGTIIKELGIFESRLNTAHFTDDGTRLVGGGYLNQEQQFSGSIKVWDVESGSEFHWFQDTSHPIISLVISDSGQHVIGHHFGDLRVWDISLPSDEALWLWLESEGGGLAEYYVSTAFNPDSDLLVVGTSYGNLLFYDTVTKEQIHTLKAHLGYIDDIMFHEDGQTLISTSGDGTVKLWRIDDQPIIGSVMPIPVQLPTIDVMRTSTPAPLPSPTPAP